MSSDAHSAEHHPPPFLKPYLDAMDRWRAHRVRPPEAMAERAEALLNERFGASAHPAHTAFAHGPVGLLADHTHSSNGFALLMPAPQGVAVALRPVEAAASRIVFHGDDTAWEVTRGEQQEAPLWVQVAAEAVTQGLPPACDSVELAVVSTVPATCLDAYLSALSVAVVRAVGALADGPLEGATADASVEDRLPALRAMIARVTGYPFSIAFLLAAQVGRPDALLLIDTATREHLPVESTARTALGWGIFDPGGRPPRDAAFFRQRRDAADEALAFLQAHGFEQLASFRELEHRDLPRAMNVLPPPLQPIVRHLVTENRRVQKLVAAMRRTDWQMVGALMLMSHASRRDAWGATSPEADFLVAQVEQMTLDSVYGACMSGRGGYVLITGLPYALPLGLEALAAAYAERFGQPPAFMPL